MQTLHWPEDEMILQRLKLPTRTNGLQYLLWLEIVQWLKLRTRTTGPQMLLWLGFLV